MKIFELSSIAIIKLLLCHSVVRSVTNMAQKAMDPLDHSLQGIDTITILYYQFNADEKTYRFLVASFDSFL